MDTNRFWDIGYDLPVVYNPYNYIILPDSLSEKMQIIDDRSRSIEVNVSSVKEIETVKINTLKNILEKVGFANFSVDSRAEDKILRMVEEERIVYTSLVEGLKKSFSILEKTKYNYSLYVYVYSMPDVGECIVFEFRIDSRDYSRLQEIWDEILGVFYKNFSGIDEIQISVRSEG